MCAYICMQSVHEGQRILTQLKKEMAAPHNRKLLQPPEGTFFLLLASPDHN